MNILPVSVALIIGLMANAAAHAHEFWFPPVTPLVAGGAAPLELRVGEYFEGESLGFSMAQTMSLRHYTAGGSKDLRPLLPMPPRGAIATLKLPLTAPGTHLVAFDSQRHQIALRADAFHAYLHDEGLDFVKAAREASGSAAQPGRERYRRHIKTLLRVSPAAGAAAPPSAQPDMTYATRTGQRLEIVPLNDPLLMRPDEALGLQIFFDNSPLAGALVKAWHRKSGQTLVIRAKTSGDGKVTFDLPYAGGWMFSLVHMVPVKGVKDVDWDSLWANLTFTLVDD